MKIDLNQHLDIPDGVSVLIEPDRVTVKGPKGELSRRMEGRQVHIAQEGKRLVFTAKKATKREKTAMGTIRAHIKNMMSGALQSHVYRLKVCSGHFPMNVAVKGAEFVVKNFLGEKVPRVLKLRQGVQVKVEGSDIRVESVSRELAGQTAASIEQLTRRPGFDNRIFQDGIYIVEKSGKEVA